MRLRGHVSTICTGCTWSSRAWKDAVVAPTVVGTQARLLTVPSTLADQPEIHGLGTSVATFGKCHTRIARRIVLVPQRVVLHSCFRAPFTFRPGTRALIVGGARRPKRGTRFRPKTLRFEAAYLKAIRIGVATDATRKPKASDAKSIVTNGVFEALAGGVAILGAVVPSSANGHTSSIAYAWFSGGATGLCATTVVTAVHARVVGLIGGWLTTLQITHAWNTRVPVTVADGVTGLKSRAVVVVHAALIRVEGAAALTGVQALCFAHAGGRVARTCAGTGTLTGAIGCVAPVRRDRRVQFATPTLQALIRAEAFHSRPRPAFTNTSAGVAFRAFRTAVHGGLIVPKRNICCVGWRRGS